MKYSQKLLELRRQFDGTKYDSLVNEYINAFVVGSQEDMDRIEQKFPTEIQLLENLVAKLKGKSVYSNLKKIIRGEKVDKVNNAIGISSLITHVLIEMKENKEYKILLKDLHTKLGKLI